MSKQHTPGPWSFNDHNAITSEFQLCGERTIVATIPYGIRSPGWRSDGQLLAAAPDLLKACEAIAEADKENYQDVLRGYQHDSLHTCIVCGNYRQCAEGCAMDLVRKALKKVEGK